VEFKSKGSQWLAYPVGAYQYPQSVIVTRQRKEPVADMSRINKNLSWIHTPTRALSFAVSDAQSLFSIALMWNWGLKGQCIVSAYHFRVMTDILILSNLNFLLGIMFIHKYFAKMKFAGVLRLSMSVGIYAFLTYMINFQARDFKHAPEIAPPDDRNDSVVLLPAACFLDRNLFTALKREQTLYPSIGKPSNFNDTFEFWGWVVISGIIIYIGLEKLSHFLCFGRAHTGKSRSKLWSKYWSFTRFAMLAGASNFFVLMIWNIERWHSWVDTSGWIQREGGKNLEATVDGIGQIAPLTAVFGLLIVLMEAAQPEDADD
jgi:hypothetical protein